MVTDESQATSTENMTPFPTPTEQIAQTQTTQPAPPPVVTTTTTQLDPDSIIDERVKRLKEGKLALFVNSSMNQGVPEKAIVRITAENIDNAIKEGLLNYSAPELQDIKVGSVMKVFLYGKEDQFQITRIGSEEQIVEGMRFAQWEWNVVPVTWGSCTLRVKATVNLLIPGRGEKSIDVLVFDHPVHIKVNYKYMFMSFFGNKNNWPFFIGGTSILGLVVAAFKVIRKKMNSNERPQRWERL